MRRRHAGQTPAAHPQAGRRPTPWNRRRTASASWNCGAWATGRMSWWRTTRRRPAHPDAAAFAGAGRHHERRRRRTRRRGGGGGGAEAPADQGRWWTTRMARSANMRFQQLHDPGLVEVSRQPDARINRWMRRAEAIFKAIAGRRQRTAHEGRSGAREDALAARTGKSACPTRRPGRHRRLTTPISQGDWRLMFLQHDRIEECHAGRPGARSEGLFQGFQPHGGRITFPTLHPDRTVVPPRPI